jgi:hypothetical protein
MKLRFILTAVCTLLFTSSITFAYQASFTPRISVVAEYSDNIFQSDNNKQDEYITTISPGFTAEVLGKKGGLNISYDPRYAKYDEFDENDGWRHDARFKGWAELSKNTRLDIRDRFRLTEDPLSEADIAALRAEEPDDIIDNTRRTSRNEYYRNNASVNLLHQFGEFDTFNLGYRHYFLENDDPTYEDKERHNPYAELTYWFVHDWGVNLRGEYRKGQNEISSDYDQINARARLVKKFSKHLDGFVQFGYATLDYDREIREDADGYDLSAGFDYEIAADISLSFLAGYSYVDRDISDEESGVSGNVKLTKKLSQGVIYLTGSGGYTGPNFGADTRGISEFYEAGLSVTYRLAKHLSGNAFGSYRNDNYLENPFDLEEKTTKAGLGLEWQALQWMSLGLTYDFRNFDTTIDADDYDENRLFLRVTLSPSVPYRTSRY